MRPRRTASRADSAVSKQSRQVRRRGRERRAGAPPPRRGCDRSERHREPTARYPNNHGRNGGEDMTISVGIDIGSGVVKTALFKTEGGKSEWLARRVERIRKRDNMQMATAGYDEVLEEP